MKKYIYTHDGVFELKVDKEDKRNGVANYLYVDYSDTLRICFTEEEANACKQGDTIEELCDFAETDWADNTFEIYCLPYEKPPLKVLLNDMRTKWLLSLKYGIKTEKGLIYVAKMNNKGELELL